MKKLALFLAFTFGLSFQSLAQAPQDSAETPAVPPPAPDCAAKAAEKKLAGAALASFLKKCERDAATNSCAAAAVEKKLKGAAKSSFTKKCVKDATAKKPE
ncbi:hypothetical protein [Methylocystis sp. S23]